jgi:hypothetical protein
MSFTRQFVSGNVLKVTEKSLFTGSHKKYIRLDFNENVQMAINPVNGNGTLKIIPYSDLSLCEALNGGPKGRDAGFLRSLVTDSEF